MSARRRSGLAARRVQAPVFAALGDETRLSLLATLGDGAPRSIAQLSEGSAVTRQAITKHLRVLEDAGIVHSARRGRESRYLLEPGPLEEARKYLEAVSLQWDRALQRLKKYVEA